MNYEISFWGLLVSAVFIGITGVYPGGIIVPSYLILFIEQPMRIAGTFMVSILSLISYRFLSQYIILFGKRRFVFMILAGGVWTFTWYSLFPFIFPGSLEFRVIGWVIPGLIANHFERQGILITTASLASVLIFIFISSKLLFFLF